MQPLDLTRVSLSGSHLIEASAGTGKTHTITGLFLRLVLELGIGVEDILVVTYTRAATAELRGRIRSRLAEARAALSQGAADESSLPGSLAEGLDPDLAQRRLTHAVLGFERASVFTIHGFCQRVLGDHAFESALPFELQLEPDPSDLLQELADDFWRTRVQDLPPGLIDYLLEQDLTPDGLLARMRGALGKPYLEVRAASFPQDLEQLEQAYDQAYDAARQGWRANGAQLEQQLLSAPLNRNRYREASLRSWLERLEVYFTHPGRPWFEQFRKFAASALEQGTRKGEVPPRHPFFAGCENLVRSRDALQRAYDQALMALGRELLEYCRRELPERRRRSRTQGYDDLLLNLVQALEGERGERLARTIRERYRAALIDEFQDTDPIQYRIFDRVYGGRGQPVFFVGDPKQAIYSFRGADLFAYLKASRDLPQRYTLEHNWRSDPAVIEAVNLLFGAEHAPFLYPEISYRPALTPQRERQALMEQGGSAAALHIWFMEGDGKPLGKGEALARAARATAGEIARLLAAAVEGRVRIGDRPLAGSDIAVLVRSHRQGSLVRECLLELGIYSVERSQDSVFRSREAEELQRVLQAVLEPGREGLVRAALCTALFGLDGAAIADLNQDEQALEYWIEAFRDYRRLWQEQGFMRMYRRLVVAQGLAERLLTHADGERRLTNLLHLGELLQRRDSERHPSMEGLLKWLAHQRGGVPGGDEEAQLRLESDEDLVQIVTIHKSKGLQYPVVFCPFLWDGKLHLASPGQPYQFHDPDQDQRAVLELGSEDLERTRTLAVQEELAENLRLLYVALTRAVHRCYLAWGHVAEAGQSPLAWLLHPPAEPLQPDPVGRLRKEFDRLDAGQLRRRLDRLTLTAPRAVLVQPLPGGGAQVSRKRSPGVRLVAARSLGRSLPEARRVTSFSALTTALASVDLPDYDAQPGTPLAAQDRVESRRDGILSFPRGARAGTCLHAIFERLDFAAGDRGALESLVEETLRGHGFSSDWVQAVADMVDRVLATPLTPAGDLQLNRVARTHCLVELQFHYPLGRIQAFDLRRVLERGGLGTEPSLSRSLGQLRFADIQGFLKGFIDLVFEAGGRFYVVDYKSNWLGDRPEDYVEARLTEVIAHRAYYLQYLFYSIALHRYLRLRLPEYRYQQHFGGVFYLFLRGMDPALGAGYGVYRDRPSEALIQALDNYLDRGSPRT